MERTAEPLRPFALRNRGNRKDSRSRSPLKRVRWSAGTEVEEGCDEGQKTPQHASDRGDRHRPDASRALRAPTPPKNSSAQVQSPRSSLTLKDGPHSTASSAEEKTADARPWFAKLRERQQAKKAAAKAGMGTRPKALAKSPSAAEPVAADKGKEQPKKANDKGKAKGKGKARERKGGKKK